MTCNFTCTRRAQMNLPQRFWHRSTCPLRWCWSGGLQVQQASGSTWSLCRAGLLSTQHVVGAQCGSAVWRGVLQCGWRVHCQWCGGGGSSWAYVSLSELLLSLLLWYFLFSFQVSSVHSCPDSLAAIHSHLTSSWWPCFPKALPKVGEPH